MNSAAINRTIGRNELQYIVSNITEHNLEDTASSSFLGVVLLAVLVGLFIGMVIQGSYRWFPIEFVFLCTGYGLQMLLIWMFPSEEWKPQQLGDSGMFHILQYCIMPLQMFRYGFQLNTAPLFANLRSVLTLSIGENLLFIFLFSFLWYTLPTFIGLHSFNLWSCIAFCSSIIASDSSVSLSFFKGQDCSSRLMAHMEMDTVLSEVIGILLFRTIVDMQISEFSLLTVVHGLLYFARFFFAATGIGFIMGVSSSLLFKYLWRSSNSLQIREIIVFISIPILAYMWVQGLHSSGSVVVRICGVLMARYTIYNLNKESREFLETAIQLLGQIADYAAFLIFGMLTCLYSPFHVDWKWLVMVVAVTFLARYTAIATVINDLFSARNREFFLPHHNQSYLLYFMFQGIVALTLVIRMEGEMLDTGNVGLILRLILFMIWVGVLEIIVIAQPLIHRKGYSLLRHESSLLWLDGKGEVEKDALFSYIVRYDCNN